MSPLATGCQAGPVPTQGSVPGPLATRSLKAGVWARSLSPPPPPNNSAGPVLIFLLFPLSLSFPFHPSETLSMGLISSRCAASLLPMHFTLSAFFPPAKHLPLPKLHNAEKTHAGVHTHLNEI